MVIPLPPARTGPEAEITGTTNVLRWRARIELVYEASLDGERKRACEIMQFDPRRATGQR
jgi:hypothetical protein